MRGRLEEDARKMGVRCENYREGKLKKVGGRR
jgi:hypothetical protein